ncbi:MAG: terpene cyclase/mutase family protein [Kiritimatiellae bacterium]|nr:terpene cyclase/mutase family protein [Kiritimatiellia bacterium]MDW8458600.1 terpene cyclase/mutase family protein [Verrucomicrobiota bacterium]
MKISIACLALASASIATADESPILLRTLQPAAGVSESLAREAISARDRAVRWLIRQQAPEGYWSNPDFPALTALPVWALVRHGARSEPAVERGVQYILSCVNENGSICKTPREERRGGGLCNYNTAIAMVALYEVGREDLIPVVQRARQFIAGTQHFGDDIYYGGMGYDEATGRPYADLSNSYIAYEAMRLTERVEELRRQGEARADLNWEAARRFIERVQNRPESNDQPWASDDPAEYGGFAYKPDSSMAGSYTNEAGQVRLRSYGSMTYAGLLSFIYAQVDKSDPRVQSAFEWALKYWNLDENPGMGQQGLYYYYQTLAKALAIMNQDVLHLADSRRINWREELIKKLVSLQRIEPDGSGYWKNDEGRWWEADPVLVTSYCLLALDMALPQK